MEQNFTEGSWLSCLGDCLVGKLQRSIIEALINTNTILGVPYYNYSIMGPQTLF